MATSKSFLVSATIKKFFNNTIDLVFAVILLFITLTMIIGVFRLFFRVGELFQQTGITGNYLYIFSDVLTLFILIELSRSLCDYFASHRLRLTPIIDASIVFVLRHIMIDLFNHKLDNDNIYALSILLLAFGVIRIGASINYHPNKRLEFDNDFE